MYFCRVDKNRIFLILSTLARFTLCNQFNGGSTYSTRMTYLTRLLVVLLVLGCFQLKTNVDCRVGSTSKRKIQTEITPGPNIVAPIRGSELKREFWLIDFELAGRVESVEEAMLYVRSFLARCEATISPYFSAARRERQIKAARLVLSMEKMLDVSMCNRKGFEISRQMRNGLRQKASLSRLSDMLNYFVEQQEQLCRRILPEELKIKLAKMDQHKIRRLDKFMEQAVKLKPADFSQVPHLWQTLKEDKVGPSISELNRALSTIPQVVSDDDELKRTTTSEVLHEIVKRRYLLEPCKYFILNFEPDWFNMISFWLPFHKLDVYSVPSSTHWPMYKPYENQIQFYQSWFRYKFCKNADETLNAMKWIKAISN